MTKVIGKYILLLCKAFMVTPESLGRGRRGNVPSPQGGFAAY